MVVYGKNAVLEALKSGRPIEKLYLQYGKFFEPEFLKFLKEAGVSFQWAKRTQLKKLSGTEKHQGIVAVISPVDYVDPDRLLREVLKRKSFFLFLDGITEPRNLGTIARSVEAFGGVGLLLPKKGSAPVNEVAVKSSAGALFHILVSRTENPFSLLLRFKKSGGKIFSVETGGKDIRDVRLLMPACLILGSEGRGICSEYLEISDSVVTIPTVGRTPSLNVSVSAGIAIWELVKSGLSRLD